MQKFVWLSDIFFILTIIGAINIIFSKHKLISAILAPVLFVMGASFNVFEFSQYSIMYQMQIPFYIIYIFVAMLYVIPSIWVTTFLLQFSTIPSNTFRYYAGYVATAVCFTFGIFVGLQSATAIIATTLKATPIQISGVITECYIVAFRRGPLNEFAIKLVNDNQQNKAMEFNFGLAAYSGGNLCDMLMNQQAILKGGHTVLGNVFSMITTKNADVVQRRALGLYEVNVKLIKHEE